MISLIAMVAAALHTLPPEPIRCGFHPNAGKRVCQPIGWWKDHPADEFNSDDVPKAYWVDVCLEENDPQACAREYLRSHRHKVKHHDIP